MARINDGRYCQECYQELRDMDIVFDRDEPTIAYHRLCYESRDM